MRRWTDVEDAVVVALYPEYGWSGCMAALVGRGQQAIMQRACRLKVFNTASPFSKAGTGEPAVPLPAPYDYAPEDRAWMDANYRKSDAWIPADLTRRPSVLGAVVGVAYG